VNDFYCLGPGTFPSVAKQLGHAVVALTNKQLLAHDMLLTEAGTVAMDIPVPQCDEQYDPYCFGNETIPFTRAQIRGVDANGAPSYNNLLSSWIDASFLYGLCYSTSWETFYTPLLIYCFTILGPTEDIANTLRTFEGGLLKMTEDGLLPIVFANSSRMVYSINF
jgi:hypothetical protein